MAGLTRSKIAYNLEISPHHYDVVYSPKGIVRYIFSSELYRSKFEEQMEKHREKINFSISNRFGFYTTIDMVADLKLYTTIEKRGFLIECNGEKIKCPQDIILNGEMQIIKRLQE